MLNPVFAFFSYVLNWREPLVSGGVLALLLLFGFFPRYHLAVLLALPGLVMLASKDPRRADMSCHAAVAPLNDDGFRQVANMQTTDDMLTFILRTVQVMNGKVVDQDRLRQFAAFASSDGVPVTDFA